jgi:hypothetical protein
VHLLSGIYGNGHHTLLPTGKESAKLGQFVLQAAALLLRISKAAKRKPENEI